MLVDMNGLMETEIEKLESAKRLIAKIASQCIEQGTFGMAKYLKYKKDIMQCSSTQGLNLIAKNMMEEVCS